MASISGLSKLGLPKLSEKMDPEDARALRNYLYQMQEQLQEQIQNTAVLENGTAEDMTLSELYEYATGTLGMREATGSEITQMGSLDNGYTVQQMQEEAVRKPTKVRFHLFGGKD